MECYDNYWMQAEGDIQRLIREDETARQNIETAMAVIFLAMRQDLRSTNISATLAKEYMHFYKCGMLNRE
jgi:hypothetical protein